MMLSMSALDCFPRLYAAASLKPVPVVDNAASVASGFPRLYAAASLKLAVALGAMLASLGVFRGFMPRPH